MYKLPLYTNDSGYYDVRWLRSNSQGCILIRINCIPASLALYPRVILL